MASLPGKSSIFFCVSFDKFKIVLCTTPTLLNSCSVVKVTAGIINALLCFPNYTLLDKTVYPATRCSAVLLCPWHTRHLPSSISSWAAFQYLVSTICSKIDKCFPWVKILNQPEVTFLLFFSKEFILLLFRLIRFDSHPFCTLLKRCFHSFPCWFPLLFNPITI